MPATTPADSPRERFLARVRQAKPAARERPTVPLFPVDDPRPLRERFEAALQLMGGQVLDAGDLLSSHGSLTAWMQSRYGDDAIVCSAVPEVAGGTGITGIAGTRPLTVDTPPASLADVDVGVVRARFGVAETGSLWFSETEYRVNAIGYLVQHLLVLLDESTLIAGLQDAYRRDDFLSARYAALVTGPSATADIEGVMIRGAQGVRSLTVIWMNAAPA